MKEFTNRNQKVLQVTVLVGLSIVSLFGCGARNTPTADSGTTDFASAIGPAASCNKANSKTGDATIQLMAYTDNTGATNPSLIRLKVSKLPAGYLSGNYDIEIRKWTANLDGVVRLAPDFPSLRFDQHVGSVFTPINNYYTWKWNSSASMEWNVVKNCVTMPSVDGKTCTETGFTDASIFFRDYTILIDLNDPNGDWKALQINFIDMTTNSAVSTTDILIPTFDADPSIYNQHHPQVLNDLHPFKDMISQGWPSTQFKTESAAFCF